MNNLYLSRIIFILLIIANGALELMSQNITTVTPNRGQIGQRLNVFIGGNNVNFTLGSTSIQTTFKKGNTTINAPFKNLNQAGDEIEVSLDLGDTSLLSGYYDLEVNTQAHGILTKSNAFKIDTTSLRKTIPNSIFKWDSTDLTIIGRALDFTKVTVDPYFFRGTDTIYSTILTPRTRGKDSLEVRINLNDSTLSGGNYDLAVTTNGGILFLRNALEVNTIDIRGHVYLDKNTNGIQDPGEHGLQSFHITHLNGNRFTFSDINGDFVFQDLDTTTHQVRINHRYGSYTTSSSDTQFVVVDSIGYFDIKYGVNTINNDRLLLRSYAGRARCNEFVYYRNFVRNLGFESESGVLVFVKDSILTYDSTAINQADSVKGDSLFLSFDNLGGLSWKFQGFLRCNLPSISVLPIGSVLNGYAYAYLVDSANIIVPGSDTSYMNSTIVRCSYDPNDKQVSPVGRDSLGYIEKGTPLIYTIRFQNTGNDTAYRVQLIDTLSNNLDWNTIEILDASHSYVSDLTASGILTFTFENIFLVDSTTNEPESNGHITFSINPKINLIDSTIVSNRAAIYFDFNPPIITNTVLSTYITITSLEEKSEGLNAFAYPNPSNGIIVLKMEKVLENTNLSVKDINGKEVYRELNIQGNNIRIDLSSFSNGIYFIELTSGNLRYSNKVVLQKNK